MNPRALPRPAWVSFGLAVLSASWATAGAAATSGDDPVIAAARDLRASGCDARPGIPGELQRSRALDDVARRWATQGGSNRLDVAFETAGVRSRQSASLALVRGRARRSGAKIGRAHV